MVPLGESGGSPDHVMRLLAILERVRAAGTEVTWTTPMGAEWHLLAWNEGDGWDAHPEEHLSDLADWAEEKWPR